MDVLKKQLEERKRKLAESAAVPQKKYRTKAEIDQERAEKYLEEQRQLEEERARKREEKRLELERAMSVGRRQKVEEAEEEEFVSVLAVDEVKRLVFPSHNFCILIFSCRLLRKANAPVTLFGETDAQREKRLRDYQLLHAIDDRDVAGLNQEQLLEKDGDHESDDEEDRSAGAAGTEISAEKEPELFIITWLKQSMQQWKDHLDQAGEAAGKLELANWKQSVRFLRPLYKVLRTKTVLEDVRANLVKIVEMCHQQEYVQANDYYLRMSIGNSAWPMGVTAVGIHQRSAREKIANSQSQVAHVLNDETQRRYIQTVKRLITFRQKINPNTIPTKNMA
eukprot:TRINITY_DN5481_c0_g1_i1.p1 TRINITY_DN5481_c0_g1~~TRINITY_DN5481_c0_g1_i1.p1  ORF type:complete len:337 (+),score=75.51 TRINITY_DN5481_c0_g1_i1:28-1038(+)